jgi:malonyl-ACP decarboxylase
MPIRPPDPVVTGIGVATGFGYGKQALLDGLLSGRDIFAALSRPGRGALPGQPPFIGVEMPDPPATLPPRAARITDLAGRVAVCVLQEAWREAGLDGVDPERIGLIVGGSNLQGRAALAAQSAFAEGRRLVSPHLAYTMFDSDLCGLCASLFPIRGFAHTVGAASASGAVAVLEAAAAVRSGRVDACIALGALQDVSAVELRAFQALGVLAEAEQTPGDACRPFDRRRRGFVFGEACAALVLSRDGAGYGRVSGAQYASGHRGPEPSLDGERRAIALALRSAGMAASDIDYVNAHATGTPSGDDTEAAAIMASGLGGAWVNASKSLLGHGVSAAGAVELAATLLQMRAGRLHATRNLADPIDGPRFVPGDTVACTVRHALSLSFGFGGVETAILVQAP